VRDGFAASASVSSEFVSSGYDITVDGKTSLTKGTIAYDSVTDGMIAEKGFQLSGSGTFTAKGVAGTRSWSYSGYANEILDQNGTLGVAGVRS